MGYDVYLTIWLKHSNGIGASNVTNEEQYKPERMMTIVADPNTGQILAMSNRPKALILIFMRKY
ncbi:hypothetical protein KHA80_19190 [Anaerobacillus sp. HL2]|nr:hypothetical protein KHA80_19190 [Anaerobacillus sp. HL2]